MIDLEFLGRSGDGLSIIFTDKDGERYNVDITDELRGALRKEHPRREGSRPSAQNASLRPRDIQALLREGITAAEISEQQGMDLTAITKYESPVLAERAWIISKAQLARVGEGPDAPILEELVIDRLAARGVDHNTLSWNALRRPGEDWEVSLTFTQGALEQNATWNITSDGNTISAIDQEAQWLTETASPLAPVSAFFPPRVHEIPEEVSVVEDLLDEANSRRGKRQPIIEEVDEIEETDPQPATDIKAFFSARPIPSKSEHKKDKPNVADEVDEKAQTKKELVKVSEPDSETDAKAGKSAKKLPAGTVTTSSTTTLDLGKTPATAPKAATGEPSADKQTGTAEDAKPKKTRKRQSVPTWDEIVFGTKSD